MDKSAKLYTKAINYYNEGYMAKALEYCERCISENLKNTSAINLKGLLHYLNGELESAQALWKMNAQVNKDSVSKKYLEDSKSDEEKKKLYITALSYIKEFHVKEALKLLEQCKKSDFNSINVNNYIALCYIKLGEYSKAITHIEEALKINKNDKMAQQSKKELISIGVIKKQINLKYVAIPLVFIIFAAGLVYAWKNINKLYISSNSKKEQAQLDSNLSNDNKEDKINKNETPKISEQPKEQKEEKIILEAFPAEDINKSVENKDYEKLYEIYTKWKDKELSINNKTLISKVNEIMTKDGVEYFYEKGRQYLSAKDYNNAVIYLTKAYSFGESSYLHSHIIYLLAVSYKNVGDIEKSINYYKLYDEKYSEKDYEDAVLYDLALIYKNIDNNLAKIYAEKLNKNYPKSMYNNSIIKEIMSKNN